MNSRTSQLVERFEQGTLPLAEFRHAEHLRVALWYLLQEQPERAADLIRSGLKRLLERNQLPRAYSERTTRLWIERIQEFLTSADRSQPVDALGDQLIAYCRERPVASTAQHEPAE